jgi:ZIP family zinc transporter
VLFVRDAPRRLMDGMMGFAGGIMVAASCWSLLTPAIDLGGPFRAAAGLLAGGAFLFAADQLLPHLHPEFPDEATPEGHPRTALRRATLLMVAITLHNFPEGLAIALPLRREGMGRLKAFWYGQLSAVVEPIAGVIGAALALAVTALLPYGMGFAAGAMLYVVVEELLPETVRSGNADLATLGFIGGFTLMMVLDTGLA